MPDEPNTREIHKELLELLKYFHSFCTDHGIRYSLHGGTLLGAIRDGGFIPWDDDIDITFTRSEYEKFKELFGREQDSPCVINETYTRFPKFTVRSKPNIFLDLFIYDYISENRFIRKLKIAEMAFFLAFLKTDQTLYLSKIKKQYTGWKYAVIYFGYLIGKPFKQEWKFRVADRASQRLGGNRTLIHRANDQFIGVKLILPAEVMEEYCIVPFEDTVGMVAKDYHTVLVSTYGEDYMTPKRPTEGEAMAHIKASEDLAKESGKE